MRNYQTKSNQGALPDSITSTRFGAGEFNSVAVELEGAVTTSGQTLAPADGTGEVTDQLAMALAIYGAGGATYHIDTGAVNAYVLTPVSPKESPNAYFNGFSVVFEPGTVNTTASTVNVGGLGVKSITLQNGTALTGGEISGTCCLKYNLSDDRFELIYSSNALLSIPFSFEIDEAQLDQGIASTNSDTLTGFDAVAIIGGAKGATIHFSHNPASGNQTIYTFSTNMSFSDNIRISMDDGALLQIQTGVTIFINGEIDIEDRATKYFDCIGTGKIRFGVRTGAVLDPQPKITKFRPEWWGAVADNSTNVTTEFEACIVAANYSYRPIYLKGDTYRIIPGATSPIESSLIGPNATIGAYDNTDDALIEINYDTNFSNLELKALIGYDIPYWYTFNDALDDSGQGLLITESLYATFDIRRILGFDEGLHINANVNDAQIGSNVFNIGVIQNNGYNMLFTVGASNNLEANYFKVNYLYDGRSAAIRVNGNSGVFQTNRFEIGAMETHVSPGDNGIYLDGANIYRNTFRINSITPNGTGYVVTTIDAHDNLFQIPCIDPSKLNMDDGNVFDTHTFGISNQSANRAARSMIRASVQPSAGYWRDGDIVWNDSPSDGVIGWICVSSGTPGTWTAFGFFNGIQTLSADNDDLDVTGDSVLYVDTTAGNIILGGLQGGVLNQKLFILKTVPVNTLTIEDNEGVGTQDILTNDGADIVLSYRGGVTLVCNGTNWFVVSE